MVFLKPPPKADDSCCAGSRQESFGRKFSRPFFSPDRSRRTHLSANRDKERFEKQPKKIAKQKPGRDEETMERP
jgi:hypothetical protein